MLRSVGVAVVVRASQVSKVGAMESGAKRSQAHALRHAWRALPGEPGPAFDAQKR